MTYTNLNITEVNWDEIHDLIQNANPEFTSLVDTWHIPSHFRLFKATYHYGQNIAVAGRLQIPTIDKREIPLGDSELPADLNKALSYNAFPVGFILTNTAEVYREIDHTKVTPLACFGPGVPLGLLETLEGKSSYCVRNIWDVVAGTRSLFMLPKISDAIAHKRMQKATGIQAGSPKSVFDHFQIFKELYNSGAAQTPYTTEVLLLSKEWLEESKRNIYWLKIHHFLHLYFFKFTGYSRNKPTIDLVWDCFYQELVNTKQKPYPHVYETVRHLFAMACGVTPGFCPAIDDNSGPISGLQQIYQTIYGLDKIPTILTPKHFTLNQRYQPIYYSINLSTRFKTLPRGSSKINLAQDIYQIKSLMSFFCESFKNGKLKLQDTWFEVIMNSVQFDYYHIEPSATGSIIHPIEMPKSDPNLLSIKGTKSNLPFKYDSRFLRGCVKISKKQDINLNEGSDTPLA